jgi:hypothetical protein
MTQAHLGAQAILENVVKPEFPQKKNPLTLMFAYFGNI